LHGELIVSLTTNRHERVAPGATLYTANNRALTIESSKPHHDRFIVRFVGVDDRTTIEQLHGTPLFADAIDDPDELWVHDLVDAIVVDQLGIERGRVVEVAVNPASDLLVLDTGALVPVRFVIDVEPNVRVTIDGPEGLFD
jgi:16S rRNA processing protein RimM